MDIKTLREKFSKVGGLSPMNDLIFIYFLSIQWKSMRSNVVWTTVVYKILSLVFRRRKKVIQVWNIMKITAHQHLCWLVYWRSRFYLLFSRLDPFTWAQKAEYYALNLFFFSMVFIKQHNNKCAKAQVLGSYSAVQYRLKKLSAHECHRSNLNCCC